MSRINIETQLGKTIVDAVWFTNPTIPTLGDTQSCIGIVTVVIDGEEKTYIGLGRGASEEDDARHIIEWGSPFLYKR